MTLIQVGDCASPPSKKCALPPPTVETLGDEPVTSGAPSVAAEDDAGRLVRITLRPGTPITADDGNSVRDRFLALTSGLGAGVLLQITGVQSVSRDAVRFLSEAVTVTAFAILGSSEVDRVIAHGMRGLPAPQCPTRYFSDEQAALAWLQAVAAQTDRPTTRTVQRTHE